jgi:hypothetical protein
MDLKMQILDTICLLSISFTFYHVKGHHDDDPDKEDGPLKWEAELNVACDHLATAALQIASPAPQVTFLPAGKATVTIAGQTVTHKLPQSIRTLIRRRHQLASFHRRYSWTEDQFDDIDWP